MVRVELSSITFTWALVLVVALMVWLPLARGTSPYSGFNQHHQLPLLAEDLCANVTSCKAGRECRVLSSGIPECVCLSHCPDKGQRPICGSDGLKYKSHCDLHRQACLKGTHIRPHPYDHSCHEDPLEKLKHELEESLAAIHREEMNHIKVPRACRQNYRDRMREYLISWMSLTMNRQPWYKQDMSEVDVVKKHFEVSDSNHDGQLDSREWLGYMHQRLHTLKRDKKSRILRKLCIEALIEEGDSNQDWRLSSDEFTRLVDRDYQPSYKYCLRDHKYYQDGTRTKVDCNGCICACGKWVCTSTPCTDGKTTTTEANHDFYDDMDNQID